MFCQMLVTDKDLYQDAYENGKFSSQSPLLILLYLDHSGVETLEIFQALDDSFAKRVWQSFQSDRLLLRITPYIPSAHTWLLRRIWLYLVAPSHTHCMSALRNQIELSTSHHPNKHDSGNLGSERSVFSVMVSHDTSPPLAWYGIYSRIFASNLEYKCMRILFDFFS